MVSTGSCANIPPISVFHFLFFIQLMLLHTRLNYVFQSLWTFSLLVIMQQIITPAQQLIFSFFFLVPPPQVAKFSLFSEVIGRVSFPHWLSVDKDAMWKNISDNADVHVFCHLGILGENMFSGVLIERGDAPHFGRRHVKFPSRKSKEVSNSQVTAIYSQWYFFTSFHLENGLLKFAE